jgi:serine/threonine-protein kinase
VAVACAGDDDLRREVESLLGAHDRATDFLERPAAEALGAPVAAPLTERLARALAGRYAIERELARGGMATVHLARDLRHHRRVAIKVLREELAAAVGAERFLEEIRVTASLQHPHILPLFDSGSADDLLWYVMPFVEGETLRSRLAREGRLPVDVALQLAREIAEALEYAHRHGIVHRDVKPENVLLQSGHALVADFGIALALEHAGGDRLTRTGISLGTPQYMAPEQAIGDRAIDARTDVYALGAVLHEMLAGESPFAGPLQHDVVRRVLHEPPTALAKRRADVSSFLDATVRKALAKQPDDRFPSAAAFAAALSAPIGGAESGAGSPNRLPLATSRDAPTGDAGAATSRGRRVSARTAMYAAVTMLVVGLAGGWALARSTIMEDWASSARETVRRPFVGASEARVFQEPLPSGEMTLSVVDRAGRPQRTIIAVRPWTPRFSPDGRYVAYGAFSRGRSTSDLWVVDLDNGQTKRLTDDDGDSNDPQWSADGKTLAYSAITSEGKDVMIKPTGGKARVLAAREGTQFPSDWLRDGCALIVTEDGACGRHDILFQPVDGSPARPYATTTEDELAARVSPDGRWVAYGSDGSGRSEVYLDSYAQPGRRVRISDGGGLHPVWRADGRELYYWSNGSLIAVRLGASSGDAPPAVESRTTLFRTSYTGGVNTMYDVSADGQRFVIVRGSP